MADTDIVTECMADLKTRMAAIEGLDGNVLQVFAQDDLLDNPQVRLSLPCLGITYQGLVPKEDSSLTGAANDALFDLLLIGADGCKLCIEGPSGETQASVAGVLNRMRKAMLAILAPGHRKWKFGGERPMQIALTNATTQDLVYIQSWKTGVTLNK